MTKREIGYAQIIISIVFLIGYFWVLHSLILGQIKTPPEWKDALIALISVITGSVGTIMAFWFSRSRESFSPSQQ